MKLSDCRIGDIVYNKIVKEIAYISGLAENGEEVILKITSSKDEEYWAHPNNLISIMEYENSNYDRG